MRGCDKKMKGIEIEEEYPTAKERWESISDKTMAWLNDRFKNIAEYETKETDENADFGGEAKCMFCGKYITHINNGGDAWAAVVIIDGKEHTVLYCNVEKHDGPDASEECEEAHNKALWFEDGEYDIIGLQGYKYTALTNEYED